MPFFIQHETQLPALAALAANAGRFNTDQDLFHQQLQQDASDRAEREFQHRVQQDHTSGEESAMRVVLNDLTRRDVEGQRLEGQQYRTDQAGAYGLARQNLSNEGRQTVVDRQQQGATQRNAATNDQRVLDRGQRQAQGDQRDETARYGIDQRTGLGYDALAARQEIERQKEQERQTLEAVRTSEQQRRSDSRLSASARRELIRAEVGELTRLRAINEKRAANGDAEAAARIGGYNDEIRRRVAEFNAPAPQAPDASHGFPTDSPRTDAGPVRVQSRDEALSLPPGTAFVTPDGRTKIRP